ncbi:murein hydrolase activator EnvC family protein [Streptomyces sp. NPDC001339]|uniref:murein hydrolase activator EnvC family protein n=1 Tax=Streptomyces sp. NPDC001339 TaxID=3364563 RepID=UPI0036A5C339
MTGPGAPGVTDRERPAGGHQVQGAARPASAGRTHTAARTDPPPEDRAWPVTGPAGARPTVLRGWQPPPAPWAAGHRGVDLASSAGAPVWAAAPGRVAYAGTVAGRGVLTLEVSRSGRPPLRTTYEPVDATVRKGQRVTAGQQVATLQRGPFHCRAPCLHWGLLRGRTYLDPLTLLPQRMRGGGHSRLLPVFGIPVPTGGRQDPGRRTDPGHGHAQAAAQGSRAAPTGAALAGAVALSAAALWAVGRLSPGRPESSTGPAVRWLRRGQGQRRCGTRGAARVHETVVTTVVRGREKLPGEKPGEKGDTGTARHAGTG